MQDTRRFAYALVLVGLAAAFWAALLPHYEAGYHLQTALFVALLLPFVIYASLTESLRPAWLLGSGLLLTAVIAAAVIVQRGLAAEPVRGISGYALPLAVCAIVLAVAFLLGRRPED